MDEDILTDPDELPEVEVERQPPKSLKLIEDYRPSHNPMVLQFHARYLEFLFKVCEKTETIGLTSPVGRGLPHVVCRAQSVALNKNLTATNDFDSYALGLVVYVWLGAALGIQQYVLCRVAVRGMPLKTSTMTSTASALVITPSLSPRVSLGRYGLPLYTGRSHMQQFLFSFI